MIFQPVVFWGVTPCWWIPKFRVNKLSQFSDSKFLTVD